MTVPVARSPAAVTGPGVDVPAVGFEHLSRLSDDTGLLEHAKGAVARREHGYCLDDVARGLVVLSREPEPAGADVELAGVYLSFVAHAQDPYGAFHNRLGYDRRWRDRPGTGDWWGRALWALGSVFAGGGPSWQRTEALDRFTLGCRQRSSSLRPLVFGALGAAQVLATAPGHSGARDVLADVLGAIGRPHVDGTWPWPEDRLSYANARIPEAMLAAGSALGDDRAIGDGLRLLEWLIERQTVGDHLSPVPAGGAPPGAIPPGFDQQPIEVAAIADAAVLASTLSGDGQWHQARRRAVSWFLGDNDLGVRMYDEGTGGGYDGLTAAGPNLNQGAESTLAWLLTLQHARRTASEPAPGPRWC